MTKGTLVLNGVDYSNGGLGGNPANNYSTEEQVIGTWIDGKPLYQKTISLDPSVYLAAGSHQYRLDDLNIDYIINAKCISKGASGTTRVLPEISPQTNNSTLLSDGNYYFLPYSTFLYFKCITDHSDSLSLYITLQYTKTTD